MTQWINTKSTVLCFLFFCVCYLAFCIPLIPVATDNFRLASVFSLDEFVAATEVHRLFQAGYLEAPSFKYGGVFYYSNLILLSLTELVSNVSEQSILIAARILCTLAGVGCLWMMYRIGNLTFGRNTGLISIPLLLTTPEFLRWTVEIHPDLLQLFWILCSLYSCCHLCRKIRFRHVVLASAFAGLAFGTKYAGVFLLPIVALSILISEKDNHIILCGMKALRDRSRWGALVLVPTVFLLTFMVTNPHAILSHERLIDSLAIEKTIMNFGHTFASVTHPLAWVFALFGLMGWGCSILATCWIIRAIHSAFNNRPVVASQVILLTWIGLYLGFLVFEVNLIRSRHLLPVLPLVLLFASDALYNSFKWVQAFSDRMAIATISFLLFLSIGPHIVNASSLFQSKLTRAEENEDIFAGRWLGSTYPADMTILYDSYAYVPSTFRDAVSTALGQRYDTVTHLEPDLLVIRDASIREYENLEDAERSSVGRQDFLDIHYFNAYLRNGKITTYRLARKFGTVSVYERIAPKMRNEVFAIRVNELLGGNRYGLIQALETMGDLHFESGHWNEAIDQYRRGIEFNANHAGLHYRIARAFLTLRKLDEGNIHFDKALGLLSGTSNADLTGIRLDMSRHYFANGYFEQAVREAETALTLDSSLPVAHYHLGASYLAFGDSTRADSVYSGAVVRFGEEEVAVRQLEDMIAEDIAAEEARRILANHFVGTGQEL